MAKKKNKHNAFRITYITSNGKMLTHLVLKKTKQAAARRAFRLWIKDKKINNQPRTTCGGWFENTTVDFLY